MTTYQQDEILAGLDEPLPCECSHNTAVGGQSRCGEGATHRVVLVCMAEGCTDAAAVYLLCRECLSTWGRRWPHLKLRITPL